MRVLESGTLAHLYFGPALATGRDYSHLIRQLLHHPLQPGPRPDPDRSCPPQAAATSASPGSRSATPTAAPCSTCVYREHHIQPGKPVLDGLPSTYVDDDDEAETVEILLADGNSSLQVRLSDHDLRRPAGGHAQHARHQRWQPATCKLTTAMSAVLDLPDPDWTPACS